MKQVQNTVVYQVYPKSFYDTNGDGLGDLRGVKEKLDYLQQLGIDYIWMNPFYRSPGYDNGYDIQDYYEVEPSFGTMADLEELISEAAKRNIRIMLDIAINHTSTYHEWFQKALQGDPEYMDYYIFRKGRENNTLPPTNWQSKFGGSAWEYVPALDLYYLHLFDVTQADLNWENPKLRQELYRILNFWIDKGVKGFRLDVINLISKPEVFEDDLTGDGRRFYTDGPKIHEYLKELNANTFGRYPDIITVGEMSSTTIEHGIRYSNPQEKELSMIFSFHHLKMDYKDNEKWSLMPLDFMALKRSLADWQTAMQDNHGWSALFWCNHDQPRIVSRFGDDGEHRVPSAKMLATAIHLMRGTPYIYQGEEIGMTNAHFKSISQYRDVESKNYYQILMDQGLDEAEILHILAQRSRDNARTPMQWDDSIYAGFSSHQPWIDVNTNYATISVKAALADADSVFYHYQKLIALRKQSTVIQNGRFTLLLPDHPQVFAYQRTLNDDSCIVICNFYRDSTTISLSGIDLTGYRCILNNYPQPVIGEAIHLRPFESFVLIKEGT